MLCVYWTDFAVCTKNRMVTPVYLYNRYFMVTPLSFVAASPVWWFLSLHSILPWRRAWERRQLLVDECKTLGILRQLLPSTSSSSSPHHSPPSSTAPNLGSSCPRIPQGPPASSLVHWKLPLPGASLRQDTQTGNLPYWGSDNNTIVGVHFEVGVVWNWGSKKIVIIIYCNLCWIKAIDFKIGTNSL